MDWVIKIDLVSSGTNHLLCTSMQRIFKKCMSLHFESRLFPRSLIQQGRPRFPWQWTPCLPETPVKLPPARCCKVTWGPSNDCHRGTASQCLGNLPKKKLFDGTQHANGTAILFLQALFAACPPGVISPTPSMFVFLHIGNA